MIDFDHHKMRAARHLLNWKQKELSERASVPMSSLAAFESKGSTISIKNKKAIYNTLLTNGVEITHNGVIYAENTSTTYRGLEGFSNFRDDIYHTVKNGGEIIVSNVDEVQFDKWHASPKEAETYRSRMAINKSLSMKILIKEGDRNFTASRYAKYKWVPTSFYNQSVPLYVYGDRTAIIVFSKDDVSVFVVRSIAVADLFRAQLNHIWETIARAPEI